MYLNHVDIIFYKKGGEYQIGEDGLYILYYKNDIYIIIRSPSPPPRQRNIYIYVLQSIKKGEKVSDFRIQKAINSATKEAINVCKACKEKKRTINDEALTLELLMNFNISTKSAKEIVTLLKSQYPEVFKSKVN